MLLNMTIANFKSVKSPQRISFEALKDSRLSESKVVRITDKLKAIKTSAIIGPNGAGKSSFVRALEVLNRVVTSPDENENPLSGALAGTVFAYGVDKATPAQIEIEVLLEKGDGSDENPTIIARYRFVANKDRIWEESLYHIINNSKKLMFERRYIEEENVYAYRYGKMYRGEKKRLAGKIADTASFLGMAARKGGETCSMLYSWFTDSLHILPMGVSSATENYIAQMLTKHPSWREQLSNFFWAAFFVLFSNQYFNLFNTYTLLIIVGTIKYIPFASRSALNSMLQLSGEIEEAALIQNVPWYKRMLRIIIPIQKTSILSGYLLPFMTCLRELSLFMLLCVQGFILATTLDYFDEMGLYAFSSGINLILIITILVCNTIVNKLTGASIDSGIGG